MAQWLSVLSTEEAELGDSSSRSCQVSSCVLILA